MKIIHGISYANGMNILYMKYFYDASKLGSVTAAAKANFVTQSAISQGISKLEQAMGCSLTAHHPNRFRLTPEGDRAFIEIADILKRTDELQQQFSKDYKEVGDLEFACTHSFALAAIPPLLKRFHTDYPSVKINFACSAKPDDIKQRLRAGQIDFGIAPNIGNFFGFEQQLLARGHYGLYVARKVDPKMERNLKFILPSPEDTTRLMQAYFNKFGKPLDVFLEVGSWEVLANLCAEGLGIGYFPDYIATKKNYALKASRINLNLSSYEICAFYPKGLRLRKSSQTFLSYFNQS